MSIREAEASDIPRLVELGSRSLKDGPYAGIIEDVPEQSKQFAEWMQGNGNVLVGEEDGKVVGLLAFITTLHHFSGQPYAAELMWYVEPEYRKGGIGLRLLWEAEKMAKAVGAKDMVFTAPNEDVAALYKRFGYEKLEVTYRKTL
jgi:ribosomal protein S18 acetylase RimI-like enzyme